MYEKEILTTIQMAHHFHSAYTRNQAYRLLRVRMEWEEFESRLNRLLAKSRIFERREHLYAREAAPSLPAQVDKQKRWSREFFNIHRNHLRWLSSIPWIRFIGLTGSNSFECCTEEDDIDLFLIADRDRLWLSNVVIGAMRRIGLAKALCLNFLIEEDHLHLPTHTHYIAVQIVQMIPIYNSSMKATLMKANPWIYEFLPNASIGASGNNGYTIATYRRRTALQPLDRVCRALNQLLFHKRYEALVTQQHPISRGEKVEIGRSIAKLHTKDHSDVYQRIGLWPLETS